MNVSDLRPLRVESRIPLPLLLEYCPAGFPSPAESYVERALDLNEFVVSDPAATYYVWAEGSSMGGAGIGSGDLLVVNAALEPNDGDVVVASVDGENTVKRLRKRGGLVYLAPEALPEDAPGYREIHFGEWSELVICGVVTHSIRVHRGRQ